MLHNVNEKYGLTQEEATRRLREFGRNEIKDVKHKTLLGVFFEQLNDPLIYVLIAAAAVSLMLRETSDAIIIAVVVCMNGIVGMIQEGKAQKALESLKKLTSPKAIVIRDGIKKEIPAAELVLDDFVCLEAGCQVPADLRLVYTHSLKIEESSLTGESIPSEKDASFADNSRLALGDQKNMAYMSTVVTYGRGEGIVVATGMDTQIGRIAGMLDGAKEEMTPLQKRLGELGKLLSILSLCLCGALFIIAVLQKRDIFRMLMTAISLAVAAVPEGLPTVVTICLALSVTRMVRVNTIIRKLPSVETLGAVSVVCTDKTGTLTQNRMVVEACYLNGGEYRAQELNPQHHKDFLKAITLCNDAVITPSQRLGDPTELALLDLSANYDMRREELEKKMPRIDELAFDSDRKMMTTCHDTEQGKVCYTKGAPEKVLAKCTGVLQYGKVLPLTKERRNRIMEEADKLSGEALRTLAIARKIPFAHSVLSEEELVFIGMLGMKDPPRPEAAQAVTLFRKAGVSTVMITGDHIETACAIGKQLGIIKDSSQCLSGEELTEYSPEQFRQQLDHVRVFARVSPAQKVQIVKGFQQKGEVVAMTGDGVNDAPSLKAADIGIAMGMTGTDVAKQTADMILTDDNFATIERAIEEGRGVYENIRKSVIFLLSSNLGEIMTMFAAVVCGLASPLKSSHILWINLITDSLPALALGVDRNDTRSLMQNSPRKPGESLFSRGGLMCTCFYGILIACISLIAFMLLPLGILREKGMTVNLYHVTKLLENEMILTKARTYAFTVLGMSQLFHAIGMRDVQKSVFRMKHGENKVMILACCTGLLLQFAVTEVPFLIKGFGTSHLSFKEWLALIILAAFPLLAHEAACIAKRFTGGFSKSTLTAKEPPIYSISK